MDTRNFKRKTFVSTFELFGAPPNMSLAPASNPPPPKKGCVKATIFGHFWSFFSKNVQDVLKNIDRIKDIIDNDRHHDIELKLPGLCGH